MISLRKQDIFKYGAFRSMAVNPTIFGFVRTHDGKDPVVVFINLSTRNVLSARSILRVDEIPANARGRILAATSTSNYNVDDIINIDNFELRDYDAITFVVEPIQSGTTTTTESNTTPDKDGGATTIFASLFLMIASVLVILM